MTINLEYLDWLNIVNLLELGADSNEIAHEYAKEKLPEKAMPDVFNKFVSEQYRSYASKLKSELII